MWVLSIYFGDHIEKKGYTVYDTNLYFNNTYKDSWIIKPLSKDIIKSVDSSDVIDAKTIESPIFGKMSPKKLSGGVKTLLLIANDKNKIFNASTCGDNCAEWILKIAEDRKVEINLYHLMDFGADDFKIKVLNTGKIVKNMAELALEAGEFV